MSTVTVKFTNITLTWEDLHPLHTVVPKFSTANTLTISMPDLAWNLKPEGRYLADCSMTRSGNAGNLRTTQRPISHTGHVLVVIDLS